MNLITIKYQVIEIGEHCINVKEYHKKEEALECFKTWIKDAKTYPALKIQKIYLTFANRITAEWENPKKI